MQNESTARNVSLQFIKLHLVFKKFNRIILIKTKNKNDLKKRKKCCDKLDYKVIFN